MRNSPREIPGFQPFRFVALALCPREAICEWAEVRVVPNSNDEKHSSDLQPSAGSEGERNKIEHSARKQDGEVQSGEVVVQKQLTAHDVEGHIVQSPANEEESTHCIIFHYFCCDKEDKTT